MAFPAGKLAGRYDIQSASVSSTTAAGERVRVWTTDATVWGGRRVDDLPNEAMQADAQLAQESELVLLRYRAGITPQKRLLRRRDATTLSGSINASVTTVTIAAALKFDGGTLDYIKVGDEIMRVESHSGTTLTVERGALETTAASHSNGVAVTRVQKLEIAAIQRADEEQDEVVLRVFRNE